MYIHEAAKDGSREFSVYPFLPPDTQQPPDRRLAQRVRVHQHTEHEPYTSREAVIEIDIGIPFILPNSYGWTALTPHNLATVLEAIELVRQKALEWERELAPTED